MIKINRLTFGFSQIIMNQMDLTIEDNGQIVGLLGPNGAGKTTLLNVLGKYYQKYSGEVESNNKIFFLPDMEYIPLNFSIQKCLDYFPNLYPYFNGKRAVDMINYLNLDFDKKIREFSKGMKEQVHIVFALAQDVDTYLFDEPLASVDPFHRDILIDLIKNYRKIGSNVVLSTHLIVDIEDVFDEVIFIKSGEIVLQSTKDKLLKKYNLSLENVYKEVIKNAYVDKNYSSENL